MRTSAATVAAIAAAAACATSAQAAEVEGYHDPGNRIGCVLIQGYDSHGNAVRCGAKGRSRGLLLTNDGSARRASWRWPASKLGTLFFTAGYNTTYYLVGGTAKLDGGRSDLRCTFRRRPSVRVVCKNGDGRGIVVTKTKLRRS